MYIHNLKRKLSPSPIYRGQAPAEPGLAVNPQTTHFLDRVRGLGVRRGQRFRVLSVLQPLVGHVLRPLLLMIVAGREQVLQALPVLVQVHPGRPGDGPQAVGVVVPVRFQHLQNNTVTMITSIVITTA